MEISTHEPSTSDFEVPDFGTCNFDMVKPLQYLLVSEESTRRGLSFELYISS